MDCVFIVSTLSLSFLLGLPFVYFIPSSYFKNKYWVTPIFGYGFIGFLATILYKHKVSQAHLFTICWVTVLLISSITLYKKFDYLKERIKFSKTDILVLFLWLLAFFVILAPYWIGGLQFALFQAWIWDQIAYVGASLKFQHKTYYQAMRCGGSSFLLDPVSLMGAIEITRRPTIMILFSFFSEILPKETYRFGYLYQSFFAANGILASVFLMRNIFNCSVLRALCVATGIFLGFWGQVYIDFGAWAMTAVIPALLVVVTYVCVATRNIHLQNR